MHWDFVQEVRASSDRKFWHERHSFGGTLFPDGLVTCAIYVVCTCGLLGYILKSHAWKHLEVVDTSPEILETLGDTPGDMPRPYLTPPLDSPAPR